LFGSIWGTVFVNRFHMMLKKDVAGFSRLSFNGCVMLSSAVAQAVVLTNRKNSKALAMTRMRGVSLHVNECYKQILYVYTGKNVLGSCHGH